MRSGRIDPAGDPCGRITRGNGYGAPNRTSTAFNAIGKPEAEPALLSHEPGNNLPQTDITGRERAPQDGIASRRSRTIGGLAAILNTHGHADHIAGNEAMKAAFPAAPLIIGSHEVGLLRDPQANLSASFGLPVFSPDADRLVSEEEQLEVAGLTFRVREIP